MGVFMTVLGFIIFAGSLIYGFTIQDDKKLAKIIKVVAFGTMLGMALLFGGIAVAVTEDCQDREFYIYNKADNTLKITLKGNIYVDDGTFIVTDEKGNKMTYVIDDATEYYTERVK